HHDAVPHVELAREPTRRTAEDEREQHAREEDEEDLRRQHDEGDDPRRDREPPRDVRPLRTWIADAVRLGHAESSCNGRAVDPCNLESFSLTSASRCAESTSNAPRRCSRT